MLEATEPIVAVKNIETPDERHAFGHASLNVVNLPGVTITRTVYQPGWKWSTDVKPIVGTEACQAAHTGYILSGRLHARMDDGREYDFGPGDAHVVSAGHDAWVEGDEPCVVLDLAFTGRALAGHVGRCPCGVEFRVASDDQFSQLAAAIREHARSSHGHELTTQQVLAEVKSDEMRALARRSEIALAFEAALTAGEDVSEMLYRHDVHAGDAYDNEIDVSNALFPYENEPNAASVTRPR